MTIKTTNTNQFYNRCKRCSQGVNAQCFENLVLEVQYVVPAVTSSLYRMLLSRLLVKNSLFGILFCSMVLVSLVRTHIVVLLIARKRH